MDNDRITTVKKSSILRVSNRGQNVFQQVANQTYSVNIPSELRIPNKQVKVTVLDGNIAFNTDTTFDTYTEIGITSNLAQNNSYNTESANSFRCQNNDILFNIDTSTYGKAHKKLITFHTHANVFEFWCSHLPEKLIFTSVATTGSGVLIPITNNNYISFTLKLEYYDYDEVY